jgi:hypothetical protein
MCTHGLELRLYFIPTLRQTKHRERPDAAICVRKSSARRVLQFTPLIGVSSVLHRPVSRVIHRLQSCFQIFTDIFQFIHNINILHFYIYAHKIYANSIKNGTVLAYKAYACPFNASTYARFIQHKPKPAVCKQ